MPYSLTWLEDVLLDAGLKVAPHPGWQERGLGDIGQIRGVICHHTGDPGNGVLPSLNVILNGRPDLHGPLAQLALGRDGTFFLIAAGRCQHAGPGEWKGITAGNTHFIGIEAENHGDAHDKWPEVQYTAYMHGVAAILKHIGAGVEFCVGHKEWARNRTVNKKVDPTFDMDVFRDSVSQIMNGVGPQLHIIPAREPEAGNRAGRPTLRRGAEGEFVLLVQRKLGVTPANGSFGPITEAAVRALQRANNLVPDGILGPVTWQVIDKLADTPPVPVQPTPSPAPAGARQIAWGSKVSPEFRDKVCTIANNLGCDPNDLMACMAFESGGTFRSDVQNQAGSGAIGLIQFMPSTAQWLGTSSDELKQMTPETQLDYVEKYFKGFPPVRTLEDVYMAILWPKAIGRPNDYVLFASPSRVYDQNSGLDTDHDGKVTKAEAAAAVRRRLDEGMKPEHMA